MRRPALRLLASIGLALIPASATNRADDKPVAPAGPLFNGKNLEGWTTWIQHVNDAGEPVAGADPIVDSGHVFQVEGGMIHVSGAEYGCLTTKGEYADYRLTVEFKWGKNRYHDRRDKARDSGILVHCAGPDKIWTRSIECQIQEGDCGDFWLVDGTTIKVDGRLEKSYKKKKKDAEKPTGEWNTVEVICAGGKITNVINGVVVNEGTDASVTRGRILLQSEGAEVWFRRVEIAPLTK